jgi:hypothetical protein
MFSAKLLLAGSCQRARLLICLIELSSRLFLRNRIVRAFSGNAGLRVTPTASRHLLSRSLAASSTGPKPFVRIADRERFGRSNERDEIRSRSSNATPGSGAGAVFLGGLPPRRSRESPCRALIRRCSPRDTAPACGMCNHQCSFADTRVSRFGTARRRGGGHCRHQRSNSDRDMTHADSPICVVGS